MERHDQWRVGAERPRGPAAESVVCVHNVPVRTAVAASQFTRGAQIVETARLELEHLDIDAVDPPWRLDLIGDEATTLRMCGRGVEARDDEDPHAPFVTPASGPVT